MLKGVFYFLVVILSFGLSVQFCAAQVTTPAADTGVAAKNNATGEVAPGLVNYSDTRIQEVTNFLKTKVFPNRIFRKLLIGVPIILLLIFLERLIPFKKAPFFRKGFFSDLGWYSILQEQLLQLIFISYLREFSFTHQFHLITPLPIWAQVVIVLLLFDFGTYWVHRFFHNSDLWRFHELHHSSLSIDWLSGLRQHPVDVLFAASVNALIFCSTGADFRTAEIVAAIVMIHGVYKHSNFRNRLGWLQYIIISAEMHRMHHLREVKYQQSNYGTVFSLWDWFFGTAYYPDEEEYKDVPYGSHPEYPQNFISANIHVFRKME